MYLLFATIFYLTNPFCLIWAKMKNNCQIFDTTTFTFLCWVVLINISNYIAAGFLRNLIHNSSHPARYIACGSGGGTDWRKCRNLEEFWGIEFGAGDKLEVVSRCENSVQSVTLTTKFTSSYRGKVLSSDGCHHDRRWLASLVNVEYNLPYLTSEQWW